MKALDEEQELILRTVRQFVEKEVIPVASAMEHRDEYPHALVAQMKEMGLFGLNIPEEYGGAGVDTTTFAMIFEEIARGWLGLAGVIGSNSVMCDVVAHFGTEEQKRRFLPDMATGEKRGGICLTESNAGTDLQAITHHCHARWRRVSHQWLEDVDHQRAARKHVPASRQDRSRAPNRPIAA